MRAALCGWPLSEKPLLPIVLWEDKDCYLLQGANNVLWALPGHFLKKLQMPSTHQLWVPHGLLMRYSCQLWPRWMRMTWQLICWLHNALCVFWLW